MARIVVRRCFLVLLVLLLLVGACGVTDQPTARQAEPATPPAGTPGPTDPADPADASGLRVSAPTFTTFTPPPYPPPALTATAARLETEVVLAVTTSASTPTPEPLRTPVAQGPLLREVWPTDPRSAPPTRFLYYSTVTDNRDTFWRVNLRNLQQRHLLLDQEAAWRARMPLVGEVAPGGHWIAYLRPDDNDKVALHLVRRNGQQDQVLATRVSHVHQRGMRRFAWSPDGRRLAYNYARQQADQRFISQIFIVDVRGQPQTTLLMEARGLEVLGWRDPTHLLALVFVERQQPLQVESIDIETGTRTILAPLAFPEFTVFHDVSPDGRTLLIGLKNGAAYLLDLETQAQTRLDVGVSGMVWSADSRLLLRVPGNGDTAAQVIPLAHPDMPQPVALHQAAYNSTTSFALKGAAPDGQYLVVCVRERRAQPVARTLLYDVAADRWDTLTEGPHCLNILGWGPPNG
jgi:Tol biopolymer transport system component